MLRTPLLVAVLSLSLSACSGDGPAEPSDSPNQSAAPSTPEEPSDPESYLPVPDGVTLTELGTELDLGDVATVAFPVEGDDAGVLRMRVDRVTEATQEEFRGWLSPQALKDSRPYFVEARVTNAGETDLSGHDVPLYLLDDNGTLGPPWAFDGKFKACPSGPLPKTFESGDKITTCLVYLAPMRADVESMAFVSGADAEPITWTGKVRTPKDEKADKPAGKKGDEKGDKLAGKTG